MTRIAVIGSGLMGHGIALTFARAGLPVSLTDPSEEMQATVKVRIGESMALLGADAAEIDAAADVEAQAETVVEDAEAIASDDDANEDAAKN